MRFLRWPLAAVVPALSVVLAVGCTSDREEELAAKRAPIIGGVADHTSTWVVGISIGGGGICSGTLIAPNLVLTARHCVSQTPERLDCRADAGLNTNKILGNYPASSFRVTIAQDIRSGPSWSVNAVRYIEDPLANRVCGYDLALLELRKNSAGAFPTQWKAPSLVPPKKYAYVAIGYGCQNPEKLGGGGCDPRGFRMKLDPVHVIDVDPLEFAIAGRVCGGDSGGPVYNPATDAIFGALSRGDGTTAEAEGCNYGLYTGTYGHLAWLQKYGKIAASNGGYAPLPWMSASPPVDAGPPETPPPPPKGKLGDACTFPENCASNLCVDFGGGDKLCSQTCTEAKPCPTGFACNGGYCYPESKMPDAGPEDAAVEDDAATPAADQGTIKAGTCTFGSGPPPRPQPWLAPLLFGAAAFAARRRRR